MTLIVEQNLSDIYHSVRDYFVEDCSPRISLDL